TEIDVSWDGQEPVGPAGQVIRGGQAVVSEDLAIDPTFSRWRAPAQRRGYRGLIMLPLRDATRTFGLLALYSAVVEPTNADELKLLQQVADDVAFGVGNLRDQSERRRLQSAVATVAAGVSAASGTEFFQQLASSMAQALGAQAGFVSELLPGEPRRGRTIAAV